ncbi:AMP-binding protein [Gordonia crocea]|uniref:AMP-binding protein n=1 Tax=Gordonia crocea TaxID=589162 RepID=UPI00137B43DB|nr:AMP-binding protein [Gordonia crocea]
MPCNHRFQTAEVVFAVNHCGASVLLVDGPLLPVVEAIGPQAPSLTGIYVYGDAPADAANPWAAVVAAAPADTVLPTVADDEPAMILYTSGSTGKPKGVTHTHASVLDVARGRGITQELTADDVSLAATAICHGGGSIGVTFPTLLAGGTVVLLEESVAQLFLDAVVAHRPTRTLVLPAQLLDALRAPGAKDVDFTFLREVQCGGDQISPELYTEFAAVTDLKLNQAYGLTECEGVAMNPPFGEIRRGSVGTPRHGVTLRIMGDNSVAAVGKTGEIQVRAASVMSGYWDDPENTAAAFVDGWLRTGDLGSRDADGYLSLSGVVGSPDERLGAIVHAFVEFEPGATTTIDELAAFARSKLAAYKVPEKWTVVGDLPRNAVGKIDRQALHRRAIALDK